jgi:hypothetical protein
MDSAPRDGTEFIVCCPAQGNVMKFVSWNKVRKYWQSKGEYAGELVGAVWQQKPMSPSPSVTPLED